MTKNERKQNVVKNIISQTVYSGIQIVMSFISRKIFLIYLSKQLLGLNSLLISVISMLSIAELGVGEAINFGLYKPLARNDRETVKSIMKLYQKLYIIIGFVIVILGIALMPFLHFIVDTAMTMQYVYKIYIIFLIDTFLSYCLAYSRNIISANQKDYIVTNVDTVAQIITNCLQIAVLIFTQNYVIYLLIRVVITVVRNYYLYRKSFLLFSYLKEKNIKPLPEEYKNDLLKNVEALFVIKLAYYCVFGTDNIILSAFCSLASVAIYANYTTIFGVINKLFNMIFDKAKAGIGNYLELESSDKVYDLFKKFFFINFVLTGYTSICTFILVNEMIIIWLGEEFIWNIGIVGLLVYNNYSRYILQSCEVFRGAAGLYSPKKFVKYISLVEGIVNLIFSTAFIKIFHIGIYGVFLGTGISTFVSTFTIPWIVYKFLFKRPIKQYFVLYFKYLFAVIAALIVSYEVYIHIYMDNHLCNIIFGGISSTIITMFIFALLFFRTNEFKYFVDLVKNTILQMKAKRKKF